MKIKKILTVIVTGALAVSCLALATGCSGEDPALREAFMQEFSDDLENVITNEYTEQTQYEVVSITTNDDGDKVIASLKNDMVEVDATCPFQKDSNGNYSFQGFLVTKNLKVNKGVTSLGELDKYSPDLANQEIRYEGNYFFSDVALTENLPSYLPSCSIECWNHISKDSDIYYVWDLDDMTGENFDCAAHRSQDVDLSSIVGTYKSESNGTVVNLIDPGEKNEAGESLVDVIVSYPETSTTYGHGMQTIKTTTPAKTESFTAEAIVDIDLDLSISAPNSVHGFSFNMKIHPDGTATVDCSVYKEMTTNEQKIFRVAEEVSDFTKVA